MAGGEAMPAVGETRPRRLDLPVIGHRRLGGEFVRISLGAPPDWHSMPGQFINVLCESDLAALAASEGRPLDDGGDDWPLTTGLEIARRWPVVRRPYSISRVDRAGGTVILEVMVRGVGLGSRFLQARPVGSSLNVVGPLGNSFTAPADDRLCILVGGGCGVAPIYGLADYLAGVGKRAIVIFGASDVGDMPVLFRRRPEPTDGRAEPTDIVDEFAEVGVPTILATEDGSAGFRGFATAALAVYLRDVWKGEPPALYGCGPTPMLKALAQVAAGRGLPCQLSLERFMGCGIGVCLSCVTKRRDAASEKGWTHRLTCREGPVVEASEMIWDS